METMKQMLEKIIAGEKLQREETKQILLGITHDDYPSEQISAMLTALQMRGVTVDELLGFRDGILATGVPAVLDCDRYIDVVGTGGDRKNTFNISTTSCFVIAGAGYKVAKHGNYGASSVSGASTVLEQHGVKFSNNADTLKRSIETCGMAYLHAPLFHPALAAVGPLRKQLGVKTLFNLLGPLVNPSHTTCQLLGVATLEQMRLYTNTLQRIGINFAVVTSLDGYDEISLTDNFKVMTNHSESIYRPSELGLKLAAQEVLSGGKTTADAAHIFDNVLKGCATDAQRDAVLVNAAFGIKTICPQKDIETCLEEARASLLSGKALKTFQLFVNLNA